MKNSIILGIDPGLHKTGWGVVAIAGNALSCLGCGTVKTDPKAKASERLKVIFTEISEVIAVYRPTCMAIEEVYVNNNARTSLKLGQARGVSMLAGAVGELDVFEYTPLQVKKSVVGYGRADKIQIGHMIGVLLPTAKPNSEDAADALAVAITHGHSTL